MENRNNHDFRTRIEGALSFGEVKVVGEQRKLLFRYKEPNEYQDTPIAQFPDEVEFMRNNCGCSSSSVKDDGIEVVYEYQGGLSEEDFKAYGGRVPYETSVTVFFKDGKPLQIRNPMGQMIDNPHKARVYLMLYGVLTQ